MNDLNLRILLEAIDEAVKHGDKEAEQVLREELASIATPS